MTHQQNNQCETKQNTCSNMDWADFFQYLDGSGGIFRPLRNPPAVDPVRHDEREGVREAWFQSVWIAGKGK